MNPEVWKARIWVALTVVAASVAGYMRGVPAGLFALFAGFVLYKILVALPASGPKYRGGTGFDDYDGGHDGGHGGDHGGDHGGGGD